MAALPEITPHSLRRTCATFAAMIGRDPKWIAAQIGHVSPAFTFSVYQQVTTRRYVDEQAVWRLMRFADEPAERTPSRQITRGDRDDPRRSFSAKAGDFDRSACRRGRMPRSSAARTRSAQLRSFLFLLGAGS
jgi:hypothetical protein